MIIAAIAYFILVPGLIFYLNNLTPLNPEKNLSTQNHLNGIIYSCLIAIALFVAHSLVAGAGLVLLGYFSLMGWSKYLSKKSFKPWHSLYLLGFAGALAPVVIGESVIDVFNYQLKTPRDIYRFGLSALDGSSIFHSFFNHHHLMLSTLFTSTTFVNALAVGVQASCLFLTLRLISCHVSKCGALWSAAFLTIPLVIILAQEAMVDMMCVYFYTVFYLHLKNKGNVGPKEALVLGIFFTFKLTLFAFAFPLFIFYLFKSSSRIKPTLISLIPLLIMALFQYATIGIPLFPVSLYLFGETFQQEGFAICIAVSNHNFHSQNGDIFAMTKSVFWRTSPFLALLIWPLAQKKTELILWLASFMIWWVLFPQERFLTYLIPIALIILGNSLPTHKTIRWGVGLAVLALVFSRSGNTYLSYISRASKTQQTFYELDTIRELLPHLNQNSIIYAHRTYGWHLPGRVITATPAQCRWDHHKDWLPQMKETGVTHLLLKINNTLVAEHFKSRPYYTEYKRIETMHEEQIQKISSLCQIIAENKHFRLYKMPK